MGSVLLIAAMAALASCEMALVRHSHGSEPQCEDYPNAPECTREYIPVCDLDGNTFPNRCVLCGEIRESGTKILIRHYGEC